MKEQYEYIEKQFRDELDREEGLHKKAQIYFSIASLVLTALLFKLKDIESILSDLPNSCIPKVFFVISIVFIFSSLFFIGWSIKIHNYKRPSNLKTLHTEARARISTEKFYSHRIIDFKKALEKNIPVNDSRALKLKISLILLLTGYLSSLIFIITIIL